MGLKIIGTGSSLPSKTVTNADLSKFLDTSDEWIQTRTGIKTRHILSDGESLCGLGSQSVIQALESAKIRPDQVDILICATLIGDYISPSLSCLIAAESGMRANCVTLDINMACCGFIYALHTANACLTAYGYRYAVVVAAEALSRTADWTDRSTCCLFGDAAGAAVLENCGNALHFEFNVCGSAEHLRIGQGGDNCPYHSSDSKKHLEMDGQEIFKFAVSAIADRVTGVLEQTGTQPHEVRAYFFHQANLRILKTAVSRLSLSWDQVPVNLDRLGNTSSATIAVLLDEVNRDGGLKQGDKLVLCAFGGGLASAACLLEW